MIRVAILVWTLGICGLWDQEMRGAQGLEAMSMFEQNVRQLWGNDGINWFRSLPQIAQALALEWNLRDLTLAENLSYNGIFLGYRDDMPIALKIGFELKEIEKEKNALQVYNGNGCVRLLAFHTDHKALLLERLIPGESLKIWFPISEDKAIEHWVGVIRKLHSAPVLDGAQFKHVRDWLRLLENPPAPLINNYHVEKARQMASELLARQTDQVLLHGDLHHDNVLYAEGEWKAIDPKGVLGDPAYEVGAFIRNPYPGLLEQSDPGAIMQHRLDVFARLLQMDREYLRAWSYVQAVLAGCWAVEAGQADLDMAMMEAMLLDD